MAVPGAEVTWTVLGTDHGVIGTAEEFLRVQGTSPNTVKSYARALAVWWTYLSVFGLAWYVSMAERRQLLRRRTDRAAPGAATAR